MAVEIDNHFDSSLVSRDHIHRFLHAEPPHLGTRSSGAVPFTTMFPLLVLWFGISVPLVFLGAYFAVRGKPVRDVPKVFVILSVALCHFVLCTRSSSSLCHPCGNISSIVSSVSLLTQAFDLLGEISWDELRAPSGHRRCRPPATRGEKARWGGIWGPGEVSQPRLLVGATCASSSLLKASRKAACCMFRRASFFTHLGPSRVIEQRTKREREQGLGETSVFFVFSLRHSHSGKDVLCGHSQVPWEALRLSRLLRDR